MSDMSFGFGETREYRPTLDGIDWHEAYMRAHPDEEDSPLWGECIDELGQFCEQLHQENLHFWLNRTDKNFDAISVIDHRDEDGDWWFTRGQIGSDEFDRLIEKMGGEATVIRTKYPVGQVGKYVLRYMEMDVESVDHIPDGWE